MSLDKLSQKSGVSKSHLSLIERNISAPTVRTLGKIVTPLGTTVTSLCSETENSSKNGEAKRDVLVFRKRERKKLILGAERGNAYFELLTPAYQYQRKIQFNYIHYPNGNGPGHFIAHEGEECGLVLEGTLKVQIQDQEIILEEGDSIYFDSTMPHRMENIGDIEVRAYWVSTPPTF